MNCEEELRTARLVLRPLKEEFAKDLWPYVSDPEFPRFMTWDAHRSIDETKGFLTFMEKASAEGSARAFAIFYEGSFVGVTGLHDITYTLRAWRVDRAELGYWIGPPFHNRGFVTEASKEMLRFGFKDLGLHKITVGCISENTPSLRVIEKLGFRRLGEQRHHMFRFNRWWNQLSYELCVDEWQP